MNSISTLRPGEQNAVQSYTGNWKTGSSWLLIAIFALGIACYMFYIIVVPQLPPISGGIPSVAGLVLLSLGCYGFNVFVDTTSVYRTNIEGIEKRKLGRTIFLSWHSLTACRYYGRGNSNVALHDAAGNCIKLDFDLIADPPGTLRTTLDTRCQSLYE